MDSRLVAQDIYTRAITKAMNIGMVSFGSTNHCSFNLVSELGLTERNVDALIGALYNFVTKDNVSFTDTEVKDVFMSISPYIKNLAKCGAIRMSYQFGETHLIISSFVMEYLLKIDVQNKLNVYGYCKLLPHWSNIDSNIDISRYFNIKSAQANDVLYSVYQWHVTDVFDLDDICLGAIKYPITAIVDVLSSVNYDKYEVSYSIDCVSIKSRGSKMENGNIKSVSFTVDDIDVSVDFETNVIIIDNTEYTKENIKNIINGLKEVGVSLDLSNKEGK